MPLAPLQTFHLVARLQSFSAAARQLGLSQPAVTQQIRRLERSLGLRLFDRVGRRIAVTDAGQTLDTYALRIVHLLDAARGAMDNLAGLRTGHLEVGASRTAGAYYIAHLLDRFKQRYPGVRVSLSVGNSESILAELIDFRLHMGLVAGPCGNPQLASLPLIRDRLLVVLPPGHRLGHRSAVSVRDLRREPMILREPGSATRRLIEHAFQSRGLEVTPAMELESNEAIKSAVADGIGVGILVRAAVAQDLETGRLVARPLAEPLYLDFSLVYHRDRTVAPVVAAFLALLPKASRPPLPHDPDTTVGSVRGRVRARSH
ncbi:MAG TPA: LysR family transcriptional regulator [bacterium]|nr:LysR family transcriptional regulator [bacterium]